MRQPSVPGVRAVLVPREMREAQWEPAQMQRAQVKPVRLLQAWEQEARKAWEEWAVRRVSGELAFREALRPRWEAVWVED